MTDSDKSSFLLYRARDAREGALLQAMLEENEIEAWVGGGQAALGFGELGADALLVDVRVRPEDAEESRRLVEAFFEDRKSVDSEPWACEACGEGNEASFDTCWSCGAERGVTAPAAGETAETEVEMATPTPEPELTARWSGWRIRVLRLVLAAGFVIWIGWACLALCQLVIPPLVSSFEGTESARQSLEDLLLTVSFLVLWLPATYFTLRWGLSHPRPRKRTVETAGASG